MNRQSPLLRGPFKLLFEGKLVGTIGLMSAEYPGGCDGTIRFTPFGESMREAMQLLTQEDLAIDPFEVVPENYVDDANWTIESVDGDRFPIFVPAIHPDGEIWWMPNL